MTEYIFINREDANMNISITYKKLNPKATTPTRGSEHAAGYDLYACLDKPVTIAPGETIKIPTGLSFCLPNSLFAAIYARSGLAVKNGLRPANAVGICDSDYRGEYIIALYNDSSEVQTVNPSDRIAQMIIQRYYPAELVEVVELNNTDRGAGGFGSTGA